MSAGNPDPAAAAPHPGAVAPLGRPVYDGGDFYRVVTMADLRAVFPHGILARSGTGRAVEYRLFVKPAPPTAAVWSMWATRYRLEHAGRIGRLSFGWGVRSAEGWETIG